MAETLPFNAGQIEAEENLLIDYQFLIQDLMIAKGISRAELALRTGISVARLSQLMGSDANPTVKTLARIFHAMAESIEIRVKDECAVAELTVPVAAKDEQHWNIEAAWLDTETVDARTDMDMVAAVKHSRAFNDNVSMILEMEAA